MYHNVVLITRTVDHRPSSAPNSLSHISHSKQNSIIFYQRKSSFNPVHMLVLWLTHRLRLCLMTAQVWRRCTTKCSTLLLSSTHWAHLLLLLLALIRLRTGHRRRLVRGLALGRGGSSVLLLLGHGSVAGCRLLLLCLHSIGVGSGSAQGDGIVVA